MLSLFKTSPVSLCRIFGLLEDIARSISSVRLGGGGVSLRGELIGLLTLKNHTDLTVLI